MADKIVILASVTFSHPEPEPTRFRVPGFTVCGIGPTRDRLWDESSGLGFGMRESHGREYDDFVSHRAKAIRLRFVENDSRILSQH
jgi:hypothetical protein